MVEQLLQIATQCLDILLHLDVHLNDWIGMFGIWSYLIFFLIIFCETGLVVTPFLPGDSFLFALGALTVSEGAVMSFPVLIVLLIVAAILGDTVNYWTGWRFGPKVFSSETSKFLNKAHLERAHAFFEKYGGKAIVIARFAPIIRTFVPFVAGIGKMHYGKFTFFNIFGGIVWVTVFLTAGRFFGNIPSVKSNFHIVIFGIIGVSLLPIVWEYWAARNSAKAQA